MVQTNFWMHQFFLERTGAPRTHRQMGYTEANDYASSGEQ